MEAPEIIEIILDFLSNEPVTVQQIVLGTRLHTRTVRKYLIIIERIQSARKVKKEIKGSRVVFNV